LRITLALPYFRNVMLSLLDLLRRIDSGNLTAAGALRLCLDAIAEKDRDVNAFVRLAAEPKPGEGPLRGIGVGIKDVIDTAELATEYNSSIYKGHRPRADAAVVSSLRRAGATILGKTATTPFAFLDPTTTRNPHDLGHTPGGSSSGSAAAVAAGMVPLAIGTQTGGSVIRPASYCGVVGVKPSARLLPTVGVMCQSWTLDTLGTFTATVDDAAYALAAMTGREELRTDGTTASPPRFGVVSQEFAGEPEPGSQEALAWTVRCLDRAGAAVKPVALEPIFAQAFAAHRIIQDVEARQALSFEHMHHRATLPPLIGKLLDEAWAIPMEQYDEARRSAHRARGTLDSVFEAVDVLLTFAAPGPAPEGLGSTGTSNFNRLWTLMGVPCVTIPAFRTQNGLPVGIQAIAPFGKDRRVLAAAKCIEDAIRRAA
jgi:Asp-tRNA(Asn)/Glu-tRNA(Gln) amidotransferase A subunit family amidase